MNFGIISLSENTAQSRTAYQAIIDNTLGNTIDIPQLVYDSMHLGHEAYPHGVPADYDWGQAPILKTMAAAQNNEYFALTGMVYEEVGGNPSVNARVAIRNFRLHYLSISDGQWHEIVNIPDATGVDGAGYEEDFANDLTGGDPKNNFTMDVDGTTLMTCWPGDTWNYHFYSARMAWPISDIAQIVSSCEAKLVETDGRAAHPYDANAGDDLDSAKFIILTSTDRWISMTANWTPDFTNNDDMGIGRFRKVTRDWQLIVHSTDMTLTDLQNNPPPLNIGG